MKDISFLEKNGVDIKQSLDLFGDAQTYNETIGEFLVGIHTKINQLIEMMNNADMNNYAITVHSLKSDAKYFGFMTLSNMALDFEEHGKVGDIFYINDHFTELVTEANKALVIVREYLTGNDDDKEEVSAPSNGDQYQSKTILVVDDSNIIRNFVKRIFSEEYSVGTASDGKEAIDIVDTMPEGSIVAILLDLNMPGVDGFAVLDYFKEKGLFEKIPVSIITGDSSKATISKVFTYNVVDVLIKPFSTFDIEKIVSKMVR